MAIGAIKKMNEEKISWKNSRNRVRTMPGYGHARFLEKGMYDSVCRGKCMRIDEGYNA